MELKGKKYWSHPDKPLEKHIIGVISNAKNLSEKLSENTSVGKWVELSAIFHDLGKINPNFQEKLKSNATSKGYANHAYLSAYAFYSFCHNQKNNLLVKTFLNNEITNNSFIAWILIIAKHHGNIPNFDTPDGFNGSSYHPLSEVEIKYLFEFINSASLPISDYVRTFEPFAQAENFEDKFLDLATQKKFLETNKFRFFSNSNKSPVNFYLDTQFTFACLIQADKTDAAKFDNLIDENRVKVKTFCQSYQSQLELYLSKLNQDSPLNRLRTEIRHDAVQNIQIGLKENKRVFELTSPTGSGKTLMLLSLASEIMKKSQNDLRIIYALPFLSITEQVEEEVFQIFVNSKDFIQRIDSKSENEQFDKLQELLDKDPSEENLRKMNLLEFMENTFAYPFVITTFVRFFETLLSNRNSELLKLPNFSNSIFLLDEIQSLPPRLYGFFVAYLSKFCEKFNSYAVISTATQPNFELPTYRLPLEGNGTFENSKYAKDFFLGYEKPYQILDLKYFDNYLFNRYQINYEKELIDIELLKNKILSENQSVLVILNTIDDTKDLYFSFIEDGFSKDDVLLLNTHFTPNDRKEKIREAKRRLKENKKIILISTQLIEAGVDIDFPVLYRDFATIPSIIQSAGRCNRNGKLNDLGKIGKVNLIRLSKNGKSRAEVIYRGLDKEILDLTKSQLIESEYQEKNLINIQKSFFNRIKDELKFAEHKQSKNNLYFHFLKDIQECQFEKIGKFQLIDEQEFGELIQYFVPKNENDYQFEELLILKAELNKMLKNKADKNNLRLKKQVIERHLKKMSGQIVQIRLKPSHYKPSLSNNESYFDYLFKISLDSYSFEKGVDLKGDDCII